MKKYLGDTGLRNLIGKIKGKLDEKADKSELAIQSNPNLLDNWYFANPINQRGQDTYTGNGYTIDRWLIQTANTLKLESDGVTLSSGESGYNVLLQKIEAARIRIGVNVTLSLLTDKELVACTWLTTLNGVSAVTKTSDGNTGIYIQYVSGENNIILGIQQNYNSSAKLIAAKLELGDKQTLAHKDVGGNWALNDPPPNYQQELAKCQRYQVALPGNSSAFGFIGTGYTNKTDYAVIYADIQVPLRKSPTAVVTDLDHFQLHNGFGASGTKTYKVTKIVSVGLDTSITRVGLGITATGMELPEVLSLRRTANSASILLDANL